MVKRPLDNCLEVFTSCVACDKLLTVTAKQTQTTTCLVLASTLKGEDLQGISSEDEVWNETTLQSPLNPMPPKSMITDDLKLPANSEIFKKSYDLP